MILGSIVTPIDLFVYGWTAEFSVAWIAPILGTALVGFGLMATVIPAESYLVDAYTNRSASAIAATAFLRSIVGALFPLIGPPLYARLGLGWGNSLLAFTAIVLAFIPALLFRYGGLLREKLDNQF